MGKNPSFSTGPTLTSAWKLKLLLLFLFIYFFLNRVDSQTWILRWLLVGLCSSLSSCHWWTANFTGRFSSTLTKPDWVVITVKEIPQADTSEYRRLWSSRKVLLAPGWPRVSTKVFVWSPQGTTVPTLWRRRCPSPCRTVQLRMWKPSIISAPGVRSVQL